jgi:hypothetical protein
MQNLVTTLEAKVHSLEVSKWKLDKELHLSKQKKPAASRHSVSPDRLHKELEAQADEHASAIIELHERNTREVQEAEAIAVAHQQQSEQATLALRTLEDEYAHQERKMAVWQNKAENAERARKQLWGDCRSEEVRLQSEIRRLEGALERAQGREAQQYLASHQPDHDDLSAILTTPPSRGSPPSVTSGKRTPTKQSPISPADQLREADKAVPGYLRRSPSGFNDYVSDQHHREMLRQAQAYRRK